LWRPIWIQEVSSQREFVSPNGSVVALNGDVVCRTWNMYYSVVDKDYLFRSYSQTRVAEKGWTKFLPKTNRLYWAAQIFHDFIFVNVDGEDQFGKKGDYLVMDNDEDLFLIPKRFFHKEYQKMLNSSDIQAVTVAFGIVSPVIRGIDISNPHQEKLHSPFPKQYSERKQKTQIIEPEENKSIAIKVPDSSPPKSSEPEIETQTPDELQESEPQVTEPEVQKETTRVHPSPGIIGGLTPSYAKINPAKIVEESQPVTELYSRSRLRSHQEQHPIQKPRIEDDEPEFIKLQKQRRNKN